MSFPESISFSRIVATAPGRCGILGNPTDMYGGSVISCSTVERARCEIVHGDALIVEADNGERETITSPDDYAPRKGSHLNLAKAVLQGMDIDPATHPFHLTTSSEIPMQAGLSGSTALVGAVFAAVSARTSRRLHKRALAEAIRDIEYRIMGVVCGFQDQHMAVFGGLNYLDFREKGSHLHPDAQPYATVEPLADEVPQPLPFLLAHTGIKHHSGSAHRPVRERWLEGDPVVVEAYERVQRLARYGKASLLAGDWEEIARLMNENQQVARDLGASGEAIDDLVDIALANGALGAKLAGAGQGGTILALTFEPERLAAALRDAGAGRILHPAPSPGLTVIVE